MTLATVLVVTGLLVLRSNSPAPAPAVGPSGVSPSSPLPTGAPTTAPTAIASPIVSISPSASANSTRSPAAGNATAIAVGEYHSCALTRQGGVKCWGENNAGQLGDGTATRSDRPIDVVGLTSGVVAISTGQQYSCAVTTSGGVKCWGDNTFGQLGTGNTTGSKTPVDVVGLTSGVEAIAAGGGHTCVLTGKGGVKCWGGYCGCGEFGNLLGNGLPESSTIPVDVLGLTSGATAITVGLNNSCALKTDGGVMCWGANSVGQLGDGTTAPTKKAVMVVGLGGPATAVAAGGDQGCALVDGRAKCWGGIAKRADSTGETVRSITAIDVVGLVGPTSFISPGGMYSCAVSISGGATCWGINLYGQLGDGSRAFRTTPVSVSGLESGVRTIATAASHTCALTVEGAVECWGNNSDGQLGTGAPRGIGSPTPAIVQGL
jgi:alpha-tubulin suppressor-like RCC1 family protein